MSSLNDNKPCVPSNLFAQPQVTADFVGHLAGLPIGSLFPPAGRLASLRAAKCLGDLPSQFGSLSDDGHKIVRADP
jgi:hypothetical protein